jgi:hypothetical protein
VSAFSQSATRLNLSGREKLRRRPPRRGAPRTDVAGSMRGQRHRGWARPRDSLGLTLPAYSALRGALRRVQASLWALRRPRSGLADDARAPGSPGPSALSHIIPGSHCVALGILAGPSAASVTLGHSGFSRTPSGAGGQGRRSKEGLTRGRPSGAPEGWALWACGLWLTLTKSLEDASPPPWNAE